MKCVKDRKNNIVRCSDKRARKLVERGYHKYTSKSNWKTQGRKYLSERRN